LAILPFDKLRPSALRLRLEEVNYYLVMTDNKKLDLITIGDSTIDTFIRIHDASVECDINKKDCKICVPYGSKIPVDSIAHGVAGNAANVAVGCARLGLATAIYTNLGDDENGLRIKETLISEKIRPDFIQINKGKESNLSVVLTFQGERTIFVYHQPWFYRLPTLPPAEFVYFSSLAETFTSSNIVDEVCRYIENSHAKLIFNPGTYQLKADIKRYPRLLEKCEVLIVNLEEAKRILNIELGDDANIRDILSKMLMLGPKIVVVTDGAEGVFPVQIVEKTGAGDGYASAFITALVEGETLEEAMVWGTVNASQVISTIGPEKGLMTRDNLLRHRRAESGLAATQI